MDHIVLAKYKHPSSSRIHVSMPNLFVEAEKETLKLLFALSTILLLVSVICWQLIYSFFFYSLVRNRIGTRRGQAHFSRGFYYGFFFFFFFWSIDFWIYYGFFIFKVSIYTKFIWRYYFYVFRSFWEVVTPRSQFGKLVMVNWKLKTKSSRALKLSV